MTERMARWTINGGFFLCVVLLVLVPIALQASEPPQIRPNPPATLQPKLLETQHGVLVCMAARKGERWESMCALVVGPWIQCTESPKSLNCSPDREQVK